MQRLAGKVAIITGGGGRIGAASARRFAMEGAKVVIADLSEEAANRIADEIGENAFAITFDAGDTESIRAMVEGAANHFGRIDILQNNAALLDLAFMDTDTTAANIPLETWDRTMEVNVRGYLAACKFAIPHLRRAGGGSIINMASNAALAGESTRIAYGSSKGAIVTMTKYIATQHGRENIRCNAILPGLILDPELEAKLGDFPKRTNRHVLLTRGGRPEDIAGMAAFFASDDSAFVTGQAISVDGGLLAHQPFWSDMLDM